VWSTLLQGKDGRVTVVWPRVLTSSIVTFHPGYSTTWSNPFIKTKEQKPFYSAMEAALHELQLLVAQLTRPVDQVPRPPLTPHSTLR
jgi:hypothetical protein